MNNIIALLAHLNADSHLAKSTLTFQLSVRVSPSGTIVAWIEYAGEQRLPPCATDGTFFAGQGKTLEEALSLLGIVCKEELAAISH